MKSKYLFFLLIALSIFSCNQNPSTEQANVEEVEPIPLELVDKGLKIFPLDYETDYQGITHPSVFQENGKEYMTFYNRPNHSIYLYDYDSAQLFKKITLDKEGPNTVPQFISFKYLIHNMDSIFIQIPFSGMYLINSEAHILHKIVSGQNKSYTERRAETINTISLDAASTFKNYILNTVNISRSNKPNMRALLNFKLDSIVTEFIDPKVFIDHYDEIQEIRNTKGKTISPLEKHYVADDQYLYATTPISDSIYVFKEDRLVKPIYLGMPSVTVADYKSYMALKELIITTSGGNGSVSGVVNTNQPPFYTNFFISPDGKYLYRLLSQGTKPAINPDTNIEYTAIAKATVLVLDIKTEVLTSIQLPANELKLNVPKSLGIFASNSGLHIPVKNQDNEDEIQFRVFGVKR